VRILQSNSQLTFLNVYISFLLEDEKIVILGTYEFSSANLVGTLGTDAKMQPNRKKSPEESHNSLSSLI
jgi:hypothetical protein